jgi:uncharacterized protein (DUF433 family)
VTDQQRASLGGVVSVNAEIMHGTPCFTGTRVPIQALVDHLEGGETIEGFLEAFPTVGRSQVIQFLELAKDQLIECASS